jgi:hypothetical protein
MLAFELAVGGAKVIIAYNHFCTSTKKWAMIFD